MSTDRGQKKRRVGSRAWRWTAGVLLAAIAAGGDARAALVPFTEGRLVLRFGSLYGATSPPLAAAPLTGVANVTRSGDGSLLGFSIPAGVFAASEQVALDGVPLLWPARGVALGFANGSGSFARTGSGPAASFAGTMPLVGIHKVCLFFVCGDPDATNLSVPLDAIGVGGAFSSFQLLRVAIAGRTWSTGSVTVDLAGGLTSMRQGGLTPTSAGGTVVQLVAPLMISTNAVGPDDQDVPPVRGYAQLTLTLAPEPDAAATLGAAIFALVAAGFWRRRAG